ncbi:GNAT family N-acetyltransferase [Nocardiopsis halophila]|uniref:GNAT family N-acetyltransferase n=1 Tax=Nocardiopsis halophila TaxID=141692 RepID=UPI0003474F96|nr:GNAT family N-acetyltransferase [Nocardiopsis halophila]
MAVIERVDPHDEAALSAWYRALRAGASAGRHSPLVAAYEEMRASLREPGSAAERSAWAAVDGGAVVGSLLFALHGRENPDLADVDVNVPEEHRGRGYGGALLAHAERLARRGGHRVLLAEAFVPSACAPEEHPGAGFALRRGFRSVHREDHLVLALPVPPERLRGRVERGAPRRGGYRLSTWSGGCPPGEAAAVAAMRTAMERAVPCGDLEAEPRVWDEGRVRAVEARTRRQGYASIASLARGPDGEPAGYSQLFIPEHTPGEVYQDDTVVLEPHRGRGLGEALKALNLLRLQSEHPDRRRVHTWTAAVNTAMWEINRRFGFTPVEVAHRLQKAAHH